MAYITPNCHIPKTSPMRQEDDLLARYAQLKDPKAPEALSRPLADPGDVKKLPTQAHGKPTKLQDAASHSSAEDRIVPLDGCHDGNVLGVIFHNYSTRNGTAIQDSDLKSEKASSSKRSPRMSSSLNLSAPLPPPTSIPPPSWFEKRSMSVPSSPPLRETAKSSNEKSVLEPSMSSEGDGSLRAPAVRMGSDHNFGDPTIYREHEKIERFRIDCWSLRSRVRDMRRDLRQKEEVKSRADDKLIQRMSMEVFGLATSIAAVAGTSPSIRDLLEDCRNARGEYGPLENECNSLEDELSVREFELTKMEKDFSSRWIARGSAEGTIPFGVTPLQSSPKTSTMPDLDESPGEHPLVIKFESRLGDLDILQERLVDVEEQREILLEERKFHERFGMSLAPGDQTWLDSSQKHLDQLRESIRATEADVDQLRRECISWGLLDEDGEPTDFQSRERNTFRDDEDMSSRDQISEYSKHPLLLPKPGAKHTPFQINPDSETKSSSVGGRINHWILGQLRESPLEVNLLERTFEKQYGEIDDRWERAVLAVWWDDGTATEEEYRFYTSSVTTQARLPSSHSSIPSTVDSKVHDSQSFRLILIH